MSAMMMTTPYIACKRIFKDPNSRTDRNRWLIGFYKYLFTPAAGFHKERNRLQYASQVRTILEEIEPKGDDITIIADEEGNKGLARLDSAQLDQEGTWYAQVLPGQFANVPRICYQERH